MSAPFAFSVGRVEEELKGHPWRVRIESWNPETQESRLEYTAEYLPNAEISESQSHGSDRHTYEYEIDQAGRHVTVVRAAGGKELQRTIVTLDASGQIVEADCDGAHATWSGNGATLRFPDGSETKIECLSENRMAITAPDGTTICAEVPKSADQVEARDQVGNWTRKITSRGVLLRTIEYWPGT